MHLIGGAGEHFDAPNRLDLPRHSGSFAHHDRSSALEGEEEEVGGIADGKERDWKNSKQGVNSVGKRKKMEYKTSAICGQAACQQ